MNNLIIQKTLDIIHETYLNTFIVEIRFNSKVRINGSLTYCKKRPTMKETVDRESLRNKDHARTCSE